MCRVAARDDVNLTVDRFIAGLHPGGVKIVAL